MGASRSERESEPPADYGTLNFIHAIFGLPAPPPEEEIIDVDAYVHETVAGLMKGFGLA